VPKKSRFADEISLGERCEEFEYTGGKWVVKFYNDGVVQAVTFAYLY